MQGTIVPSAHSACQSSSLWPQHVWGHSMCEGVNMLSIDMDRAHALSVATLARRVYLNTVQVEQLEQHLNKLKEVEDAR